MLRLALAILRAPFFWGLLGLAGEQLNFLVFLEAADGSATPLGSRSVAGTRCPSGIT